MDSSRTLGYAVLSLLFCVIVTRLFQRRSIPYPPGPRGVPFLGNIGDMPQKDSCQTYARWAKEYGDIQHMNLAGEHLIILNTAKASRDLLERRAENYSNRPHSVMSNELLDMGWSLTVQSGEAHRRRRALVQKYFIGRVQSWQEAQLVASQSLVRRMTEIPEAFYEHISRFASEIVLKIGYGYDMKGDDDELLRTINRALDYDSRGPYVVDWLPFLKYLPEWTPLVQFHKDAKEGRRWCIQMRDIPFEIVKKQMAEGTAQPSFTATLLEELAHGDYESQEAHMIRDCAGVMYGAGSDSTAVSVHTFIVAMMLYPEVQQRAQGELDTVLGKGRLPTFADRENLPYVDAMVMEILRWNVVTPLGVIPHASLKEDTYMGYRIPAGSQVTGNLWAIFRDPQTFPDPEVFDPARFSARPEARDVMSMAFGWGRRVCPGRQVADASIFIAMASLLASVTISKPRDTDGNPLDPCVEWSEGFVRRPLPFKCTIVPR